MGQLEKKLPLLIFLLSIFLMALLFFLFFKKQRESIRAVASKEEIFSDFISKELKEKTLNLFKGQSFAEDISDFVVIGNFFEGTTEYGKIYLKNLEDLNKNPFLIFFAVREKIKLIPADDHYIRGRLIALVDKLEIPPDKKMEFFGEQIIRKVVFESDGYLSDDSKNITQSMALFRHYSKLDSEVLKYATDALELNQRDKRAAELLISRFKIYFPKVAKDLVRPQEK